VSKAHWIVSLLEAGACAAYNPAVRMADESHPREELYECRKTLWSS